MILNYSRARDRGAGGRVCFPSEDRHSQLMLCSTHAQGTHYISEQCQNRGMSILICFEESTIVKNTSIKIYVRRTNKSLKTMLKSVNK